MSSTKDQDLMVSSSKYIWNYQPCLNLRNIQNHKNFQYAFNDSKKVRAKYWGKCFKWVTYAKVENSNYKTIRNNTHIDGHDCGIVSYNKLVTSQWLATNFLEHFRLNPNMDYTSFKSMVCALKFSNVFKTMFYMAKKKARLALEG